jgi:competence protein ComFB
MEIHNITDDIVLRTVNEIFDAAEKDASDDRPCTCSQCRLDTACYVLNRTAPFYVVSSRGVARAESEGIDRQQAEADVISLAYEGMLRIAKSKRPHFEHDSRSREKSAGKGPWFNIPTIIGRVFNGSNFEPMSDIEVSLLKGSAEAEMIDANWQNPYRLVANTAGTFSFWPKPELAKSVGEVRKFEFAVIARASGLEELRHFFEIQVTGEAVAALSFSMQRTHKLPELYLFPPGNEEND